MEPLVKRYGKFVLLAALAAPAYGVSAGGPPLKSTTVAVQLRATVSERLSLVSGTDLVGFSLRPRELARGDRPVIFTTSWNLERTRTAVVVSAYFEGDVALTAAGAAGNGARIAPDEVKGRADSGTYAALTGAVRWPGVGMELFRQPLRPGVNDMSSRTDELELEVDLTRRALLASGQYEGVLTLVAEAY